MNTTGLAHGLQAVLLAVMLCLCPLAQAQSCGATAHTRVETKVYDTAPALSTAEGWHLGTEIATLPAGAVVQVCESQEIGQFGLNKTVWLRVEFNGQTGWIYRETTDLQGALQPARPMIAFGLVADAVAGERASSPGNPGNGLPGSGTGPWLLLIVTAVFVFLGIIGKMIYDGLAASLGVLDCIRLENCIKALIVAPLAIAAFLQIGDFTLKNESATLIYWCMAFQNGFFWQTLLPSKRTSRRCDPARHPMRRESDRLGSTT